MAANKQNEILKTSIAIVEKSNAVVSKHGVPSSRESRWGPSEVASHDANQWHDFRNTKLTMILSHCLQGSCKILKFKKNKIFKF